MTPYLTKQFCNAVQKQWKAAFRKRTGAVAMLPMPSEKWFPPYLLGPSGFALGFCNVRGTRWEER